MLLVTFPSKTASIDLFPQMDSCCSSQQCLEVHNNEKSGRWIEIKGSILCCQACDETMTEIRKAAQQMVREALATDHVSINPSTLPTPCSTL